MRFLKSAPLTIPAGEQASSEVAVGPMIFAHSVYAPKELSGHAVVQVKVKGDEWCEVDVSALGKADCVTVPNVAATAIRVYSDTVETEERTFTYAYVYQEN